MPYLPWTFAVGLRFPGVHGTTMLKCELGIINEEDATVAQAVQTCLPLIAAAIDIIVPRLLVGGRVVYTEPAQVEGRDGPFLTDLTLSADSSS